MGTVWSAWLVDVAIGWLMRVAGITRELSRVRDDGLRVDHKMSTKAMAGPALCFAKKPEGVADRARGRVHCSNLGKD